jgi:hypothetical protein
VVALIIIIDEYDREDGERKDHARDQEAQAYRDGLFGKQRHGRIAEGPNGR